jgi:hypothetical protein
MAAGAATDASARLSGGKGLVGLRIDAAAGEIQYVVATNLGDLESVQIKKGNQVFVDLDVRGKNGSASGTFSTKTNLAQLEKNPNAYSVEASGSDGSAKSRLKDNGASNEPNDTPIDLVSVGTTAAKNGRIAARVRNRGKVESTATSVTFYASNDAQLSNNDVKLAETAIGSIKPGKKSKAVVKVAWPASLAGESVFVIGLVDGPDVNNDPNTANNADATNKAVNIPD